MIHPHMLNQFLCVCDNVLSDGASLFNFFLTMCNKHFGTAPKMMLTFLPQHKKARRENASAEFMIQENRETQKINNNCPVCWLGRLN